MTQTHHNTRVFGDIDRFTSKLTAVPILTRECVTDICEILNAESPPNTRVKWFSAVSQEAQREITRLLANALPDDAKSHTCSIIHQWQNHYIDKIWPRLRAEGDTFIDWCQEMYRSHNNNPRDTLRAIAADRNLPTTEVGTVVCPDFKTVWQLESPEGLTWREMLAWTAKELSAEDPVTGWKTKAVSEQRPHQNGKQFETQLLRLLPWGRSEFQTEADLMREQEQSSGVALATVDVLFKEPVLICNHHCKWIEFKNCLLIPEIAPETQLTKTREQLQRYVDTWGPGIVLWGKGYVDGVFDNEHVRHFAFTQPTKKRSKNKSKRSNRAAKPAGDRSVVWFKENNEKCGPFLIKDVSKHLPALLNPLKQLGEEKLFERILANARSNAVNRREKWCNVYFVLEKATEHHRVATAATGVDLGPRLEAASQPRFAPRRPPFLPGNRLGGSEVTRTREDLRAARLKRLEPE